MNHTSAMNLIQPSNRACRWELPVKHLTVRLHNLIAVTHMTTHVETCEIPGAVTPNAGGTDHLNTGSANIGSQPVIGSISCQTGLHSRAPLIDSQDHREDQSQTPSSLHWLDARTRVLGHEVPDEENRVM